MHSLKPKYNVFVILKLPVRQFICLFISVNQLQFKVRKMQLWGNAHFCGGCRNPKCKSCGENSAWKLESTLQWYDVFDVLLMIRALRCGLRFYLLQRYESGYIGRMYRLWTFWRVEIHFSFPNDKTMVGRINCNSSGGWRQTSTFAVTW